MTDATRDLIQRLVDALEATGAFADEARAYLDQHPEASVLAKDFQSQIQALRVCYLRMANAVANQLPDRTRFFVDLMSSVDENL